jgi:hypothetical protein
MLIYNYYYSKKMHVKLTFLALALLLGVVVAFHATVGHHCEDDHECGDGNGWEYCDLNTKYCVHKSPWPMFESEYWGLIVTYFIIWIANVGGTGGAGMLIPIIVLFMKFDTKNSIALSNFSIFLSSTQRYLLNSVKTHPLKDGRGIIVDLNIVLVCLPLIIMGVVVGYIINNIFPSTLILICYVLILTWVGWGLFVKTSKLRKEENLKF